MSGGFPGARSLRDNHPAIRGFSAASRQQGSCNKAKPSLGAAAFCLRIPGISSYQGRLPARPRGRRHATHGWDRRRSRRRCGGSPLYALRPRKPTFPLPVQRIKSVRCPGVSGLGKASPACLPRAMHPNSHAMLCPRLRITSRPSSSASACWALEPCTIGQ